MAFTVHSKYVLRSRLTHPTRRPLCCHSHAFGPGLRFTPQSPSLSKPLVSQGKCALTSCVELNKRHSRQQHVHGGLRGIIACAYMKLGDLGIASQLLPELFSGVAQFDDEAASCLQVAYNSAKQKHSSISTQHLLYGLLTSDSQSIQPFLKQLQEFGITAESIQQGFPEQEQSMWGTPVLDKEAAWLLCGLTCRPCDQNSSDHSPSITPLQLATHLCRPLAVIMQEHCTNPEQAYIKVILSLVPEASGDSSAAEDHSPPCRSPLSSNDDDIMSATSACWILEYGVCSPNLFPSLSVNQLAKCLEVYAFLGLPLPSQWQQKLATHLQSRPDLSPSGDAAAPSAQEIGIASRNNKTLDLGNEEWVRLVVALAAALTQESKPHHDDALLCGANPLLRVLLLLPSLDVLRQRDSFSPKVDHLHARLLAEVADAMSACSSAVVVPLLPDILAVAERWSEVYSPYQLVSDQAVGHSQLTEADNTRISSQKPAAPDSLMSAASTSEGHSSSDLSEGSTIGSESSDFSKDRSIDSSLHISATSTETSISSSMLASCLTHIASALQNETLPRTCIADALAALSPFVEHAAGGRLIGREGHHPVAVVDKWLDLMTQATPRSQSPASCSIAMLTVSKLLGDSPDASHINAQRKWCFETTEK